MNQKELWEKKFEKKNRYGIDPCPFAVKSLKWMKNRKTKKILDIGGGEGKDSVFFAKNGYEVFCLDFSENAIKSCKENVEKNKVEDLVHPTPFDISIPLNFADETFDAVFAHLSLHYFDDRTTTKIFDQIKRVLKKGGMFFVRVKSIKDPLYGRGEKIGKDIFLLDGHIRHFFSKDYLLGKLSGFEILSIEYIEDESEYAKKSLSPKSIFLEAISKKL